MLRQLVALICGIAVGGNFSQARVPDDSRDRAEAIGKPVSIEVQPRSITLSGPRATQQVVVTGMYPDGSQRDLTAFGNWVANDVNVIDITSRGRVISRRDGITEVKVKVGSLSAKIPITVKDLSKPLPVSFRREVMPILSTSGCSDIRCHGAPSGKNGFRLSLWGSNPDLDYRQLTHNLFARRTNSLDPNKSLVLNKALARIPHVGGRRFRTDSDAAKILYDWQAEGLGDDTSPVELKSLIISPAIRVLKAPARWQQLSVQATFADDQTVDVTHLTTFSSSDISVADVDRTGFVEFNAQGEVAILCRFLGRMETVRLIHIEQQPDGYEWPNPPENNNVDKLVFAKLKMMNIAPAGLCTDAQFVRRLYIDLCGILPTPEEARAFLESSDAKKRTHLIDQLLLRPEFAENWTKKWLDVLRVSRDSIQWAGSKAYQDWIRERIQKDVSFGEIVGEMLTSKGKSFTDAAANYYCVPQIPMGVTDPHYLQKDLAEATAQLFLGVRLQCAKCHNHPYERWTQQDYLGLAAHFTQVKRTRLGKAGPKGRAERRQFEITLNPKAAEVTNEETGDVVTPQLPGQPVTKVESKEDRRQQLAEWLTSKDNPFFAKAIVNRVWYHLHGRGIVEPVDDFRDSNPSVNDKLLTALAQDFAANNFRLKHLIRMIASSRTYQLSPIPNELDTSDGRYFSRMQVRPLPAEILFDAICNVTGVPEQFKITKDYTIGVPEGFVDLPADTRAVQLPVNDIVTLINTGSKYVRYESHPFLRAFGQPTRTQTCECDREQKFGRKQALELIIGEMTTDRLSRPKNRIGQLMASKMSDRQILDSLYLRGLSRLPSRATSTAMLNFVAKTTNKRQAWEDVVWTMMNSQEFVYQH